MPKMTPPVSGVKIRLYRKFLGDCILLAFPTSEPELGFYMLIDCGAFAAGPLEDVARDIVEATGGKVDVVVMTHEHQDHLSGFGFSRPKKVFQNRQEIAFCKLWMAWTEDKSDKVAKDLRRELAIGVTAMEKTAEALTMMKHANGEEILEILETSFAKTIDEARKNLLNLVPNPRENHFTWSPGEWCQPLGEGGMRVFFLGPPKDRDLLRTNEISGEHYDPKRFSVEAAFHSAVLAAASGHLASDDARPFHHGFVIGTDQAKKIPFFKSRYFDCEFSYKDEQEVGPGASWRRIDVDWLDQATDLALQYDGYINNTSLVMAIELPETGKVVLFPGDAQGGNWQSWSDEDNREVPRFDVNGRMISSVDLLRRTVFYKVGHHGSHNGTLKAGLEQLGTEFHDQPLVAVIPTDEMYAWTKKTAGQWKMPYLPLYSRLLEKTKGRLIQGDIGLPDRKEKNETPHPNSKYEDLPPYSDSQWKQVKKLIELYQSEIDAFRENAEIYLETPLYIEYTVLDD